MYSDLLTPAQNRLFFHPRLKELRDRLGLEPIQSKEVRRNINVDIRIQEWISQFKDPTYIHPPSTVKYTSQYSPGIIHESPF